MAIVWLRHPRYSLLIFVALITTFYLLFLPHVHDDQPIQSVQQVDDSLESRVQLSHAIYDKVLAKREGLIKKHGPNPKDISLCVVVFIFCQDRF